MAKTVFNKDNKFWEDYKNLKKNLLNFKVHKYFFPELSGDSLQWTLSAKDQGATESPVKWFGTKFEQNCTLEVFCCLSAFSCCWLE